jgi:transposase
VASYLGLIPREESSGGRQKLGAITKQGNRLLRALLVEAAQIASRARCSQYGNYDVVNICCGEYEYSLVSLD